MIEHIGIEARLAWALLTGEEKNCLEEGGSPYAHEALEMLEARELFNLMGRIREPWPPTAIIIPLQSAGSPASSWKTRMEVPPALPHPGR